MRDLHDTTWLNRACVDAVREILGMDPLYRPVGEEVALRSYPLPEIRIDADNGEGVVAARYGWFENQVRRLGRGERVPLTWGNRGNKGKRQVTGP